MHTLLLPALNAESITFDGIHCYVAGDGPPLLLLHSVNAAASAADMRPLFERYRKSRRVFAVDLPGFGLSARSERNYTPRLMTDALHATLAQIRLQCGDVPVDALAVSLGCEFLARAAVEAPARFNHLALVSPTGLQGNADLRQAEGSTRKIGWLHAVLRQPLWAEWLFRQLSRPGVVRYFLQRTWGSKHIDETLWAYSVQTAHQPGARHAPLQFLARGLFSADIHRVYEGLTQPVWMSQGVRGDFTDFRALARLRPTQPWQRTVFATGALPYFEALEFGARFDDFLRSTRRGRLVTAPQPQRAVPAVHFGQPAWR